MSRLAWQGGWRRNFSRGAAAVALAGLVCATPASPAGSSRKPEEFVKGILAQDAKDWKKSADLLREALQKQPEDGQPVRLYGTRYYNYLPSYYLGLALYKQGKCGEALKAWDASLNAGYVQQFRQFIDLQKYRDECMNHRPE